MLLVFINFGRYKYSFILNFNLFFFLTFEVKMCSEHVTGSSLDWRPDYWLPLGETSPGSESPAHSGTVR